MQNVTCVYSHTNPYLYLTHDKQTQYCNKSHAVMSDSICGDICEKWGKLATDTSKSKENL
jgi:hypothetical protein